MKQYDYSFSESTLSDLFVRQDLVGKSKEELDTFTGEACKEALEIVESMCFPSCPIKKTEVHNRTVYVPASLPNALVLRKLSQNLKTAFPHQTHGRNVIIRDLHRSLHDTSGFQLCRLDIKSFFSSIDRAYVLDRIFNSKLLSPQNLALVDSLFAHCKLLPSRPEGLPRGLGISSVLSEIALFDFDKWIMRNLDVFYYARFVDDMVLLTHSTLPPAQILGQIQAKLPNPLTLNTSKSISHTILEIRSKTPVPPTANNLACSIHFLGYVTHIFNATEKHAFLHSNSRFLKCDLSERKMRKIKTRVLRAFLSFAQSSDFELLIARIRFLTTNYPVRKNAKEIPRLVGIYFNNTELDSDSPSLKELDTYLCAITLGHCRTGLARKLRKLNSRQKKRILGCSFSRGFASRRVTHFGPHILGKIQECWNHD